VAYSAKWIQQVIANNKRYLLRNQQWVLDYLKLNPCVDCGEADPVVLEFDHKEGLSKDRTVAKMVRDGVSLAKLIAEVKKCVVRCANCHRRKTVKERGWFRGVNSLARS
jgi:hypothetical protein